MSNFLFDDVYNKIEYTEVIVDRSQDTVLTGEEAAGDTIIIDGIECLVVATNITIQECDCTNIAIDKNYDLGYYIDFTGQFRDGYEITSRDKWRWGAYGLVFDDLSDSAGCGMLNTDICENRKASWSMNEFTYTYYINYPFMWEGVNNFRRIYGQHWFVPSRSEIASYISLYADSLNFNSGVGANSADEEYHSSYGGTINGSQCYTRSLDASSSSIRGRHYIENVRMCRAF